jgi:DNA repair exonuclease SbcCD ATPase subunit
MNTINRDNVERKIIYEENDVSYTFVLFENVLHIEAIWQVDYAMWTTTIECASLSVDKIADETKMDTSYIVTNYTPTDKFNIINDYVNKKLNPKEYIVRFKKVKNTDTALFIEIITNYQYSEKEDISIILIEPKPIGFTDKILKNVDIHKNSTNARFSQLKDEINARLISLEDSHKTLESCTTKIENDYITSGDLEETISTKHKELETILVTMLNESTGKYIKMEKTLSDEITATCSEFKAKINELSEKITTIQTTVQEKLIKLYGDSVASQGQITKLQTDLTATQTSVQEIKKLQMDGTATQTSLQEQITKLQTDLATCISKLPQ